MKIFEISDYDLNATADPNKGMRLKLLPTPAERAIQLLLKALKTVNEAGLEGKRLTDISVVHHASPSGHPDDTKYEIHAKVQHRLKP